MYYKYKHQIHFVVSQLFLNEASGLGYDRSWFSQMNIAGKQMPGRLLVLFIFSEIVRVNYHRMKPDYLTSKRVPDQIKNHIRALIPEQLLVKIGTTQTGLIGLLLCQSVWKGLVFESVLFTVSVSYKLFTVN